MKAENLKTEDNSRALKAVGIFAALAASLCCITPVLALLAGASGVASAFSWMDPARPYFIGLAIVAISYAWYRSLFPANVAECGPDGICKVENKSFLASRTFLIIITILAIVLMTFPYYSKIFYPQAAEASAQTSPVNTVSKSDPKEVSLKITGMTCAGCTNQIHTALTKTNGVIKNEVKYPGNVAIIKFDSSKISVSELIKVIEKTGYKVEIQKV